jgi:hypothetical protein
MGRGREMEGEEEKAITFSCFFGARLLAEL